MKRPMKRPIKRPTKENMPEPGDLVRLNPLYFDWTTCGFGMFLRIVPSENDKIDKIYKDKAYMFSQFELLVEDRIVPAYGYEFLVL